MEFHTKNFRGLGICILLIKLATCILDLLQDKCFQESVFIFNIGYKKTKEKNDPPVGTSCVESLKAENFENAKCKFFDGRMKYYGVREIIIVQRNRAHNNERRIV